MAQKTYTLFLAKPYEGEFADLLSETAQQKLTDPSTQTIEAPEFAEGGRIYVFVGDPHSPGWIRELNATFDGVENVLVNSASAVLFFRRGGATLALTFAHGWLFLDDEKFEGDFGLRVALNALDPARLKKLERANLGDALTPTRLDVRFIVVSDAMLPNDRDESDNTVPNRRGPSMTFMQACMEAKGHRLNIGRNLCEWASHPNDLFSGYCYE